MAARLEFPDGSVYLITEPTSDAPGERFEMEMVLPAEADPPPAHIHPHLLFREHADTIAAASPPQRAMMAAMAAVGRLLRLELPPRRSR